MRRLIITADDFGLSTAVNEAVELAHRDGVLTAASLMVGAPEADDAIARARRLPGLAVGLHVALVQGSAILPPAAIPDLVDAAGRFSDNLFAAGVRYFFHPRARAQLRAEIAAQFEAFRATGLRLDHVNAHNHMHLHPTVLSLILEVGQAYGMRAMRLPFEPTWLSWRATHSRFAARASTNLFLQPWIALMRARLQRANVTCNDTVFGLHDSGAMREVAVLGFLERLPAGISEIYFHPAMNGPDEQDFHVLTSSRVRAAVESLRVERGGYLAADHAG